MHVVVASHHRLPVEGYGGPQRVVVALVEALAALGHRVTVLAQPGTKLAAASRIVEISPRALKNGTADLAPFLPDNADIVHAHFPLKQGPKSVPFVQTLHGNWKPGAPLPPHTIFLSRDHARRHGSETFVYNGLDPADFIFRPRKEQWDLFLGKLHSDRGYHWAVEAAKRTGRRLIIAGGWCASPPPRPSGSRGRCAACRGTDPTAPCGGGRCIRRGRARCGRRSYCRGVWRDRGRGR